MNIKKMKGKAGFTLIELMIVVIIIGILAASAVPIYRANVRKAYAAEGFATLGAIRSAERLYKAEWDTYRAVTVAEGGIKTVFGLDTTDNQYWNNGAFKVTGASSTAFTATATGSDSTAPGAAKISGMSLTMDQTGVTTGP